MEAPYTATFYLAVCQNAGNCLSTGGVMLAYSFTPTLINGGIPGPVAAGETQASPTIAEAGPMTVGHLEAGGGTPIDFWKVALNGGDVVQITTGTPSTSFDGGCAYYLFGLWPQGTTDTSFSQVPAMSTATTPCGSSGAVLSLTAPSTGTYVFGLCEDTGDCRNVDLGGGIDPIQPYTFTTALIGGNETSTAIKLSSSRVQYAIEQKLEVTATVKALFGGGTASGKVVITTGKTTVCTIATLSRGAGTCHPASGTLVRACRYALVATYSGHYLGSTSGAVMLTVKP